MVFSDLVHLSSYKNTSQLFPPFTTNDFNWPPSFLNQVINNHSLYIEWTKYVLTLYHGNSMYTLPVPWLEAVSGTPIQPKRHSYSDHCVSTYCSMHIIIIHSLQRTKIYVYPASVGWLEWYMEYVLWCFLIHTLQTCWFRNDLRHGTSYSNLYNFLHIGSKFTLISYFNNITKNANKGPLALELHYLIN